MSQKCQVKQLLHFRAVKKWWVGSSQTRSRMDWALQYTLEHLWAPEHPETSLDTPKTTPDAPLHSQRWIRHLRTPTDTNRHSQTLLRNVWGLSWSVWRCLAVSVDACMFLVLALGVQRVSRGVYWIIWVIFRDVSLVWRCSRVYRSTQSMQNPVWLEPTHHFGTTLKCEIFSPDAFKTAKYQNLPMCPNQKWFSYATFCNFWTCHKEITIDSFFWSPCMNLVHLVRRW